MTILRPKLKPSDIYLNGDSTKFVNGSGQIAPASDTVARADIATNTADIATNTTNISTNTTNISSLTTRVTALEGLNPTYASDYTARTMTGPFGSNDMDGGWHALTSLAITGLAAGDYLVLWGGTCTPLHLVGASGIAINGSDPVNPQTTSWGESSITVTFTRPYISAFTVTLAASSSLEQRFQAISNDGSAASCSFTNRFIIALPYS